MCERKLNLESEESSSLASTSITMAMGGTRTSEGASTPVTGVNVQKKNKLILKRLDEETRVTH